MSYAQGWGNASALTTSHSNPGSFSFNAPPPTFAAAVSLVVSTALTLTDNDPIVFVPSNQRAERLVAIYAENAPLPSAPPPLPPSFPPTFTSNSSSTASEDTGVAEISLLVVLTDVTLYLILHDSLIPSHTFAQAPVPVVLASHPLYTLSQCIIFFGFQRCVLQFEAEWDSSDSGVEGGKEGGKDKIIKEEDVGRLSTSVASDDRLSLAASSSISLIPPSPRPSMQSAFPPSIPSLTTPSDICNEEDGSSLIRASMSLSPRAKSSHPFGWFAGWMTSMSDKKDKEDNKEMDKEKMKEREKEKEKEREKDINSKDVVSAAPCKKSATYSYAFLPRDKSKTYPLITRIPQQANAARCRHDNTLKNVRISNKDSQLLDAVTKIIHAAQREERGSVDPDKEKRADETNDTSSWSGVSGGGSGWEVCGGVGPSLETDVVLYQMLWQIWRQRPGVSVARSLIVTPAAALLCSEDIRAPDVRIRLIDSSPLKNIQSVSVEGKYIDTLTH